VCHTLVLIETTAWIEMASLDLSYTLRFKGNWGILPALPKHISLWSLELCPKLWT